MNWRAGCLLACWLPMAAYAVDIEPGKDPVPSVMWAFYHKQMLGDAPFVFDDRVKLHAPPFAEDARQVPLEIDARAFKGDVVRILAWAELNPLPKIVDFQPLDRVLPWLSLRIRIEQATPLRAAVLTRDGLWHVGSTLIDAAGGGCTAPSVVRTQPGWEEHIGEVLGGRYPRGEFSRLRLQVAHPMDNGMVSGIPEFFINHAELRDGNDQLLARLELFPAVSENPNLAFDIQGAGQTRLLLRDNSGNQSMRLYPDTKERIMRWMLLLFMGLSLPALADLDYSLKPRQIAEDTWLLEGSTDNFAKANGGNIVNTAFIVTEPGVVVIDTGPSKRYGEAMRKAIAAITDKPVIQVLLTHHHPDHVLGNQAFSDVPIGALAGTTELLRQQGDAMAENMYRLVGDWMRGTEVVLPTRTPTPGVQSFGNHDLHLLSLGGHTGADLAILDRKTGVLFAGDLVFYQRALTTPNSPGLAVWLSDIATLQGLPCTLIVPGHGPVATDAKPFEQMRDYLTWLDQLMRDGAANGSDMAEMIRSPIPDRFAGISLSRYELIRSVSHLYPRYERAQMTRVDSAAIK